MFFCILTLFLLNIQSIYLVLEDEADDGYGYFAMSFQISKGEEVELTTKFGPIGRAHIAKPPVAEKKMNALGRLGVSV